MRRKHIVFNILKVSVRVIHRWHIDSERAFTYTIGITNNERSEYILFNPVK